MKANVLYAVGDLRFVDVNKPLLKDGEVLVNVKAAGICGSDVERVFVNGTYKFPTIIGHEFAGKIVETFSDNDKELIGKQVTVFPLIPCMKCNNCIEGKYELCTHYNYLGSRCDGGFAEYVAVPKWNLSFIPEGISYETAAMLEPAAVALHSLRNSKFKMGDSVAIVGPGTIGIILAQLAKIGGASKVMLIGRNSVKLDFAKKIGIDYICNSTNTNVKEWIDELTGGLGVDIAIEGTGVGLSMDLCLNIVKSSGRILAMGNPKEDINLAQKSYWQLLRKQISIYGTWNSSFGTAKSDWALIFSYLSENKLNLNGLITHRFKLAELYDGLLLMKDPSVYSNKVMIINE
jgi:L-iditol 2-dehydrogenase